LSNDRPRICLVSQLHPAFNPRLVKEADALTEAGYEVVVVAGSFSRLGTELDVPFEARAWTLANRVRFGPETNFVDRIFKSVRTRISRKIFRRTRLNNKWLVYCAWHPITLSLIKRVKAIRADLYIAHLPSALPAAASGAKKWGGRLGYDAEDFYLGDPPESDEYEDERALVRDIEGQFIRECDYITAASPGIAAAYGDVWGVRPTVILNVFPRSRAPLRASETGDVHPRPSVYWFSQTIGADRGLECAVRAIAASRSRPHLYLRGQIQSGFDQRLRGLAEKAGVADHVHFQKPAPPSEMERICARYDAGLAAETGNTPNHRIALANKIFSYMLAGIPAFLSDIPAHRQFANGLAPALNLYKTECPASLAEQFDLLFRSGESYLSQARGIAFDLGQDRFNWEIEKENYLDVVAKALESRLGDSQ